MKSMIKRLLLLCLVCLLIPMSVTALAAEEDVILISTPKELDAIRNDLDGHYRLANDIDMAGFYDFEPIGNEVDGPFTGILDGAGYTIRNLELRYDSYKYVGLFGYLDGTVTDLTLEDIVVEASRYAGGLAGYADGNSRIEGITVSGSVTANSTYFTQYAGGIVGYAVCGISDCTNYATVEDGSSAKKSDYIGGIAAYVGGDVTGCGNYANLSYNSYTSTAGIVNQCGGNITGCANYGSGPTAGISYNCSGTISDCINSGDCRNYGIGNAHAIKNCSSMGNIGNGNAGIAYGIGYATTSIENCFVTGFLAPSYYNDIYCIGNASIVKDSYAVVSVSTFDYNYLITNGEAEGCMAVVLNTSGDYSSFRSEAVSDNNMCIYPYSSTRLVLGDYILGTDGTLEQIAHKYDDLDYEMNWTRDENWFSGLPIPANLPEYLELSDIVLILDRQESAQLKARIGTTEVTDLTWTSADNAIATVNGNGLVTAWGQVGTQTVISATTDDGLRMDCLVIISDGMPQSITISPNSAQSLRVGRTFQFTASPDAMATQGTTITWSSSNTDVATVDQNGLVTTHALGNATITARTVNGKTASATVNVTYAADLILETEEVFVPYNKTVYVPYTLSPAGATDSLTVSSSNTNYVRCGTTTVSGKKVISINGYNRSSTTGTASQTVMVTTTGGVIKTIRATVVDMIISSSESVNVNKTREISLTKYPADLDQQVTWTSSDETIATVDDNGVVTGIRPGAVTITATSEYGITQSCIVNVTNYANEVHTDRSYIQMLQGTYDQVSAWMIPLNTTSGLSYSSSNASAVTVDSTGKLYAKATGSSLITVTASGSGEKTTFSVYVVAKAVPATDLEISTDKLTMHTGDVAFLSAAAIPADTTDSQVTWTSSDADVVTVAPGGVVTAVSGGSAVITAKLPNGLSRTCAVNVRSNEQMDISAATVTAFPGETIQVPIMMDRNPGTAAMRLKIFYDSDVLIPAGLTKGAMLSGITITDNTDTDGEWVILWSSPTDVEDTGTMFTLSFAVSDDAPVDTDAELLISCEPGDIVDAEHIELLPDITNGCVRIRKMLPGDVYEDRTLNSHDILLLQQHLTELVDFTDHQKLLGDLDQDDDITMRDLVSLAQKLVAPSITADVLESSGETAEFFTVTVGDAALNPDGTVELPVVFSGCPGISAFKFHVYYDENVYELVSIDGCSEAISAALMTNLETPGDAVMTWYSNENQNLNGQILTLRFRLAAGARAESSAVFLSCESGDLCRDDLEALDPALVSGEIRVPVTVASGWSGDTTWALTDDGVLTFSGSGNIKNYGYDGGQPWTGYADQIISVVVEEGITRVGSCAFMGMTNLETVTLPDSLTHMGEAAFYGCTSLTSVEIPANLWTIQPYTFKNCTALTEVIFHEGNLQKISDGAFYGTGLTELLLPDCLDILDVYAFKGCADLKSITIGNGLTELREAVFYGTAISEIDIPEGITKIGPYVFKNCVNLETIDLPESLTSVGEAAFYDCAALASIELPDAATSIGNYAFRRCVGLTSVIFGENLTTIGECSFYGCTGLTELVIPDKVTTINPYAFKTCTGLTSVTLGRSVERIGEGAFNTCTGLKTIVFPASLKTIGDYCFSGSYNLWKLTFEGDAPTIGTGAFKGMAATAYYPGDNATWTSDVMQNYGGQITWKAN